MRSLPDYTVTDIFTQIGNGTAKRIPAACFSDMGKRFSFYRLWGSVIRIETHQQDIKIEEVLMLETGDELDLFNANYR